MAQQYKRRAKNFFIKKNFQGKIVLAVFLAVIVSCLFFMILFGVFSADTMTISYQNNDLQMGNTPLMLFKKAIAANWIFLIICGTLVVIASMIGSHRIAGPIFRLEKAVDSMIRKNLDDTIFLRGKDEGKDLASKINDFNLLLSKDLRSVKRHASAITDLLNQYESLGHNKLSPEDVDSICKAIRNSNDKLKRILEQYRLVDE